VSPERDPAPELGGARVALVHEWLLTWGGSERVLQVLAGMFPDAPIFTGLTAPDAKVAAVFGHRDVHTSRLQRIPGSSRYYQKLLPLMPGAFEALDLSGFDVVISSSHAFAKAVRVAPPAVHLCYCHTPPRYLWDLYRTYSPGWRGTLAAPLARHLRRADVDASRRVSRFLANSRTVAERIHRHYGRESSVVHPPVDVELFSRAARGALPEDWFLAGGRMVPYKRLDVLVEAANRGRFELKVFGDGPERRSLERRAGPTVQFLGALDDAALAERMARCRAFLFAAEEDFGILPVEAQAAGRPVVAWGRGGATETVVPGETGLLLEACTAGDFAWGAAEATRREWDPQRIRENASRFDPERFRAGIGAALRHPGRG